MRSMSLCLPGYYGEMCSSAVPLVPVRGAGVGCVGSRPTCHLGLRDFLAFLASDMLFLRLFPGSFAPFAFSQCEESEMLASQYLLRARNRGYYVAHPRNALRARHVMLLRARNRPITCT